MRRQYAFLIAAPLVIATLGCGSTWNKLPGRSKPYAKGTVVVVTGVVTDAASQPLEDVEVHLEATDEAFDFLRFRKKAPVEKTVAGRTSADGAFELEWPWDKAFEHFELVLGVTVAEPGGERFHRLHQQDLSKRIRHGSPVVSAIRLEDTSFLEAFLAFRAQIETEAEERVYREAGKPDKVQRRVRPGHTEVDWWYFELGKVYLFRDGELTEVEEFEPVINPFDAESR